MINIKKFFPYYFILLFTGCANILIYFDIPVLRQVFGFVLVFIPGFLLVDLFGLHRLSSLKKFCLTWGLSIAFLLGIGVVSSFILLVAGFFQPLIYILVVLDFCIIILLGIHFYLKRELNSFDNLSSLRDVIKFSSTEKILLLYLLCLLVCSILGSIMMNYSNNNSLLILYLILLFIGFSVITFFYRHFSSKMFPLFLYFAGLSIILVLPFRSSYLLGIDTHMEYYYFYQTLLNQQWLIVDNSALNVCLSITTLPTIFYNLLNISPIVLFKFLFPIIFSISPLVIFIIAEKYLQKPYCLIAGLFFCVQTIFFWATINARTIIALLFVYLIIFVLLDDEISNKTKNLLAIIFFGSCLVSHYSTTYIAFFIFTSFAVVTLSHKDIEFKNKNVINILTIFCFLLMLYFWYGQIINSGLSVGKGFYVNFSNQLDLFLSDLTTEPVRSNSANALLGKSIFSQSLPYQIKFFTNWEGFILIGLGLLAIIFKNLELSHMKIQSLLKNHSKTDGLFITLSIISILLLILSISLPYISKGYGIERIYAVTFPITSILFVFGAILCATCITWIVDRLKNVPNSINCEKISVFISLAFLISIFACTSGLLFTVLGTPYSLLLETSGAEYNSQFIHDQELTFSSWYIDYYDDNLDIFGDQYSTLRFKSDARIYLKNRFHEILNYKNNDKLNYIFIRYFGTVDNKGFENNIEFDLKEYDSILIKKDVIYANGGSTLYYG